MSGYTKLFSSIVASTVWNEDNDTRIVWITLLALADRRGVVEGSVPGLAVLARVSVDGCRAAITKLSNPDPDSRNKTQDGRRIEAVDGGWRIINHGEYRQKLSEDDRREYQRQWMADKRAKERGVDASGQVLTKVDGVDISRVQSTSPDTRYQKLRWDLFDRFYAAYPRKKAPGAAKKAWTKLHVDEALLGQMLVALDAQRPLWTDPRFIPYPATWLNEQRWLDEPDPAGSTARGKTAGNQEALRRFLAREEGHEP